MTQRIYTSVFKRMLSIWNRWHVFTPAYKRPLSHNWLLFFGLSLVCIGIGYATTQLYGEVLVRPSLGLTLGAILVLSRKSAVAFLITSSAVSVVTYPLLFGTNWWQAVVYPSLTVMEACVAAALTRRYCGALLDLSRPRRLANFFIFAIVPATVVRVLGETYAGAGFIGGISDNLVTMLASQFASMGLLAPLIVALCRPLHMRYERKRTAGEVVALYVLLFAFAALVFGQDQLPLLFIAILPLVWISFRLNQAHSIVAAICLVTIAAVATAEGHGPISLVPLNPQEFGGPLADSFIYRLGTLQIFIASTLASVLPLPALRTEEARFERRMRARHQSTLQAMTQVRTAKQYLQFMAEHDPETGLNNRAGLIRALADAVEGDRVDMANVFVAAIKIDRYASFRAAIGSAQAGRLVRISAERMKAYGAVIDIARTSPDTLKIAFLAEDQRGAMEHLEHLSNMFREPIPLDGVGVDVRFTIGLADHGDFVQMLHHAEMAVDHARKENRKIGCYDPALAADAANGLTLLSDLHAGLSNGDVWISYQPKLNLRSGILEGAECLIRWSRSNQLVGPDVFIPIAEETGFIDPLTDWIVAQAAQGQRQLAEHGLPTHLSINVSAYSLSDPAFHSRLLETVLEHGGDPRNITLELTETSIMRRSVESIRTLRNLEAAGFAISIDDYGTGQSSLRYLRRIPASELKIDRSFIANLSWDKKDAMLVRSTIDLAHGLGLEVVAEGVEDEQTLTMLTLFGCDHAQGYHIARPMSLDKLLTTYQSHGRLMARA